MSDNVIYMSGYSVYDQAVDGDRELEANTTSFAKEIHAKVTEKKPTRFVRAPGDELPALECTVESDKALGRCLSVVDGRRFYIVSGLSVKPQNGEATIDRFLKSFKLASSAAGAPSATVSQSTTPSPVQASTAMPDTASRPSDFEEKAKSLGLVFKPPEGYQVVPPKENRDMKYDYALRHPTKEYEVRYALQPIPKEMLEEFKQWSEKKDKGDDIMTDPDIMFEVKFRAIMANIGGKGNGGPPQHFKPENVKAEFGADSGMAAPTEMSSQFGKGYKMCLLVGIHKKNIGDVFVFHLFNDFNEIKEDHIAIFYALKFSVAKN